MGKCGKDILKQRFGSDQDNRFIEALNPESFNLVDLSIQDWMTFAYRFAKHVNYFNNSSDSEPEGDWTAFFEQDQTLKDLLEKLKDDSGFSFNREGKLTPHLALFISFLKLLEYSQKRFNGLLKRHLNFYFKDILDIQKLPATPDKVHVIFELARSTMDALISKDSELDAGKDADGKKLIYRTSEDLVANKIAVSELKTLYTDYEHHRIKAAPVANSYDGKGADFPDNVKTWWPFGYYHEEGDPQKSYPELRDAKFGFAVASGLLRLSEGLRTLVFKVYFDEGLEPVPFNLLHDKIQTVLTGEKNWLGPYRLVEEVSETYSGNTYKTELSPDKKQLTLVIQLPKAEEPVTDNNDEIHKEAFATDLPVCRFLFDTTEPDAVDLYRSLLGNKVTSIELEVCVEGITSIKVENDQGLLNVEKPFYAFGINPDKDSNFYISYDEMFRKNWTDLNVDIQWKNTPVSFRTLYIAYRQSYKYEVTPFKFLTIMGNYLSAETTGTDFVADSADLVFEANETDLIVEDDSYFTADLELFTRGEWVSLSSGEVLFTADGEDYFLNFNMVNSPVSDRNGPLRVTLNQSFLHELYPKIYTLALRSDEENVLIPNEPYTPVVDTIELNYTAMASCNFEASEDVYRHNDVRLYHEHPFGQTEEHPWLKQQSNFLSVQDKNIYLVPTACSGGELYIGLDQVSPGQQVALLIQVLEGSENPLADSFTGKQKVEWSVLCNNEWKKLNSDFLISNETDNFLRSGIVKIQMPGEVTFRNTRLPSGKVWLRARMHKSFDVVCRTFAVTAQAVKAVFQDQENDLSHLINGLEAGTISKLKQRPAQIKGVTQPFNSFGGVPEESDEAYYRRISERLRHKNRAVTLWDYEHIILQAFPEIYKVKCLNHSRTEQKGGKTVHSYLSPGNVLLVVIPDTVKKNVFDMYQPRVSKAMLNRIEAHINRLNTLHVDARVINPDYEVVKVDLKVKFEEGYDENFYLKQLNEDITRYLSPWAFRNGGAVEFGVSLHRSHLINTIEKLQYVDYIEDVRLLCNGEIYSAELAPSSPTAILVSAKQHNLGINLNSCKSVPEDIETCQT
ncbi:baseplate J/gp47 family protein [Saccharicrinis sp. FJH54]|uniref:baseplate J/gp47 family protein n=1 Tax=Saccharicrinis sp. FJH54 TaxID=3344665 RepID=UPI0035D4F6E5